MPSYTAYKRQVMDADDNITWITMKGNHIPIKEGQTKEEAVKEFLAKKGEGSAKHGSGEHKEKTIGEMEKAGENVSHLKQAMQHVHYGFYEEKGKKMTPTQFKEFLKSEQEKNAGKNDYYANRTKQRYPEAEKLANKDPFATKTKENHKNEIINGQTHFTYTDPDGLNFRVTESSNDPGWKSSNLPTESFKSKEEAITASKERLKSDKLKYGDFSNKRNKEYMFNVYKKGFAESEPEMGDPNEAQRLSGIEKPKTEKHKDLRSAFGKHYDKLYNDHDLDDKSGYLLDEWDKHIKDPKFKKAVQEFVQERGDFISSDREVKAFMLAAKETGLIPQEKKASVKNTFLSNPNTLKEFANNFGISEKNAKAASEKFGDTFYHIMTKDPQAGVGLAVNYEKYSKEDAEKRLKELNKTEAPKVTYVDPKKWNSPASDPWKSLYD